jgi:hypothetical protein
MRSIARKVIVSLFVCFTITFIFTELGLNRSHAIDFNDPSLIGAWLFNEGKGDKVRDSSPNGNDGMIIGGGTWVAGMYGSALEFTGTTYVDAGNAESLSGVGKSITLAALLKAANPLDAERWVPIAQKGRGPGSYQLHFNTTPGTPFLNWNPVPGSALPFAVDLTDGEWHYIVAVFDDPTDTTALYLDGALAATGAETASIAGDGNGEPFFIGDDWAHKNPWIGLFDEVAVWGRTLSESEIMEVMASGLGEPGLGEPETAVSPKERLATLWGAIKAQ